MSGLINTFAHIWNRVCKVVREWSGVEEVCFDKLNNSKSLDTCTGN